LGLAWLSQSRQTHKHHESSNHSRPKCLEYDKQARLKRLEFAKLAHLGLTWLSDPSIRVKKFKFFQKHDSIAKTNAASFKQDFSFICSRT